MTDPTEKKDCRQSPVLHIRPSAHLPDSPPPSPTNIKSFPVRRPAITTLQPKAAPDSDEEIDLSLETIGELRQEIKTAADLALRSVESFTLKRLQSLPKTLRTYPNTRQSLEGIRWKAPKKRDIGEYWEKEHRYVRGGRGRSTSPQKPASRPLDFVVERAGLGAVSYVDIHSSGNIKQAKSRILHTNRRGRTRSISDFPAPEPDTSPRPFQLYI